MISTAAFIGLFILFVGGIMLFVVAMVSLVRLLWADHSKRLAQRRLDHLHADYRARREEETAKRRAELDVIARGDDRHAQRFR